VTQVCPSSESFFDDARIARVRITSGDVAPGPDDSEKQDVVVMDDFLFGEPQAISTKAWLKVKVPGWTDPEDRWRRVRTARVV